MKETQEKWQRKRMIQKSKVENLQRNVKNQGITLIALVATIVILLILSGVTINMLLGENGIIRTAQEAKNTWESAVANEQEDLENLMNELNSIMNDNSENGNDPSQCQTSGIPHKHLGRIRVIPQKPDRRSDKIGRASCRERV